MESVRSANRIVTCLRSPSSALLSASMWSGTAAGGEEVTGCPHPAQNLAVDWLAWPHARHVATSAAPQLKQKRRPGWIVAWHCRHVMSELPAAWCMPMLG